MAKVATLRSASDAVDRFSHCGPMNIWTSQNRKGAVSDADPVYSPRAQQKEKGKGNHVCDCHVARKGAGVGGIHDMAYDTDRDRFHPIWRWVLFGVCCKLLLQSKVNLSLAC